MSTYLIKHLKVEDFNKGYVDLLSQLSSIDKDLILENQFKICSDQPVRVINLSKIVKIF